MTMRRRMKEDNRGIALISVMICVMLSFLLSATIMRVSLLSYLQKGIAKQATTTFYENETFVDDIKLGVQQKVAMAFANSSSTSQASFLTNFKTALLAAGSGGTEKAQLESALASFISNSDTLKVVSVTVEGEGGVLFKPEGEGEYVIKNVKIEYTDNTKDGYVSKIKTDIRIKSPFYITTTESEGSNYSIVASNGAMISDGQGDNRNQWGSLRQNGNAYIGYDKSTVNVVTPAGGGAPYIESATALDIKQHMAYWLTGERVIINGDIKISGGSDFIFTGKSLEVRGTIYIANDKSHLILSSSNTKVTCKDIVIGSTSVGSSYSPASTTSITGLPVDFTDQASPRTTWSNVPSLVALYTGTTGQNGTTKGTTLGATKVTKNPNARPVPNVDASGNPLTTAAALGGSGEQYDYEYWKIIDVAVLKQWTNPNSWKEPKLYASNYTETSEGKYTNISGPDACSQHEDPTVEGKKFRVNVGQYTQSLHDGEVHVMFKTNDGPMMFDQLNTSQPMAGVFIASGQVVLRKAGQLTEIKSIVEWYGNDLEKAKRALGFVGSGCMVDNGNYARYCINNLFRGGIKALLKDSSGGGGVTVSHDETKNKSVEVVSFENWEKY